VVPSVPETSGPCQSGSLFDGPAKKGRRRSCHGQAFNTLNRTGIRFLKVETLKQITLGIVWATNTTHYANSDCAQCSHAQEVGSKTFFVTWPAILPGG